MSFSASYTVHCDGPDGACRIINVGSGPTSRETPPCVLTIFGATGDLTKRKLLPALYDMAAQNLLPDAFAIVGYGRRPKDEAELRGELAEGVREFARLDWNEATWDKLAERIFYHQGAYDDPASYEALQNRLIELDGQFGTEGNRIYYIATPPGEFGPIIENLGQRPRIAPTPEAPGWRRVIVEKPFGRDLRSAHDLNELLGQYFDETEVFRIDHYLGKETVQNILALRFANVIWEPLWNNRHIDHVQIVVAEEVGVGRRGGYYETSGAMRDMVENHMLQLLTLVTMEPPVALDANAIRDEKVKVLRAIRKWEGDAVLENTLRGQYEGYQQEEGVTADSRTETYVALRMFVDNWRWAGVPFYMRHGKHLPQRATEIVIRWKDVPNVLFNQSASPLKSNMLTLRIQPEEGFDLRTNAKVPGSGMEIRGVHMDFDYSKTFGAEPPEAYERLLHDALLGDGTLFTRRDETEVAWDIAGRILDGWENGPAPYSYAPHSWGPEEADAFIARDGRHWRRPLQAKVENASPNGTQDKSPGDTRSE
jgi:glucose-6-phosphate 1-dehydrogenase